MSEVVFSPVSVPDCNSPSQEVLKVALARDIDERLLEARLKRVYYLITLSGKPPRELIPEELPFLDDEGFLLQHDLVIEQRYFIVIDLAPRYTYHFSLTLSPNGRELYFRIAQGSKINRDEVTIKKLFERIRIQKADMHVLIRDEKTEYQRLRTFIQSLPDEKFLSKSHEFLLAKSIGGLAMIEPHLEEAVALTSNRKYRLIPKDQLIATFFKGQAGEAARDCLGRFIAPAEPTQNAESPIIPDETIRVDDDDSSIKYYAKEAGYIVYDNNKLSIAQKIKIKNASSTSVGNLMGGLNTSTHITISSTDILQDAVGEGMVIEAGTIEIVGNVGNKAIIRANKVIIKGQTHQNSQIFADYADVGIHKGLVIADTLFINRLEAGIAKGDNVKINNAYGGKSYGENLQILTLHSNHQAYAGTSVTVNALKGEDNKFILCANAAPKKEVKYQAFLVAKKQCIQQLAEKQRIYTTELAEIKKLQPLVKQIKEDIANKNVVRAKIMQEQARNYRKLIHFVQQLKKEINSLSQKLEKINNEIMKFEENINEAFVLIKSGWNGYNEVRLKKLFEESDIVMNPYPGKDGPRVHLDEGGNILISTK